MGFIRMLASTATVALAIWLCSLVSVEVNSQHLRTGVEGRRLSIYECNNLCFKVNDGMCDVSVPMASWMIVRYYNVELTYHPQGRRPWVSHRILPLRQ